MPTNFGSPVVNGDLIDEAHINALRTAINDVEDGSAFFAVASGSVNVMTVTLSPTVASLAAGFVVRFQANNTNTGTATLNVNGVGALALKRPDGNDVQAGDIVTGCVYTAVHNGTHWRLVAVEDRPDKGLGTPTEVGNTGTGEDNLQTLTVPGNSLLVDGQRAIAEFHVTFAANGDSKQVKAYCGATQVYDSGAQNQNGGSMRVRIIMMRDGASAQKVAVEVLVSASSLFANVHVYTTASLTMSSDIILKLTGESGAATDNNIVGQMALLTYG